MHQLSYRTGASHCSQSWILFLLKLWFDKNAKISNNSSIVATQQFPLIFMALGFPRFHHALMHQRPRVLMNLRGLHQCFLRRSFGSFDVSNLLIYQWKSEIHWQKMGTLFDVEKTTLVGWSTMMDFSVWDSY